MGDNAEGWYMRRIRELETALVDERLAIADLQKKADTFGVALMMIREGCETPADFARRILAESSASTGATK